jgi:hypothetical protein
MRSPLEVLAACPDVRTNRAGILVRRPELVVNQFSPDLQLAMAAFAAAARLMSRDGAALREERLLDDGLFRRIEQLAYGVPAVERPEAMS